MKAPIVLPPGRVGQRLKIGRKVTQGSRLDRVAQVDYYTAGQMARASGRPVWANPGTGREADEWRRGYASARPEGTG